MPHAPGLVEAPDAAPERLADAAWDRIEADLDERGFAVIKGLLDPERCRSVASLFPDDARFRKPVVPGDTLHVEVVKQRHRGSVWRFACEAKVGGALAAEATITAMILDE